MELGIFPESESTYLKNNAKTNKQTKTKKKTCIKTYLAVQEWVVLAQVCYSAEDVVVVVEQLLMVENSFLELLMLVVWVH